MAVVADRFEREDCASADEDEGGDDRRRDTGDDCPGPYAAHVTLHSFIAATVHSGSAS